MVALRGALDGRGKPRPYDSRDKLGEAFEDAGGAHAATYAHGDHAVASFLAFHFAQNRGGELGAGAAERMAEGDGAAVDIDARGIEAGELHHGERLRGKGFVQFDYADLV